MDGRKFLKSLLNKIVKIQLSDNRILIGIFLCTDKYGNTILGECAEYFVDEKTQQSSGITSETKKGSNVRAVTLLEPRVLGMVMVPGKHISAVYLDESSPKSSGSSAEKRYEEVNVNIVENESNHAVGFAGWIPK